MRRIMQRHPLPHHVWHKVTRQIAVLQGLDAVQMAHLRELTAWFLHTKAINGVHGLEVTLSMRVAVAAQACLLILIWAPTTLTTGSKSSSYPGAFRVNREQTDAMGWYTTTPACSVANHGCAAR